MVSSDLESLGIKKGSEEEKILLQYVDASIYQMNEWTEALREFQEWINENKREYSAKAALEYLHCCDLSTSSHVVRAPLWKVVSQMLENFGFDDRKESC